MPDKTKIREVIEARHGGFKGASNHAIMTIWHSLSDTDKKEYLKPRESEVRSQKSEVRKSEEKNLKSEI